MKRLALSLLASAMLAASAGCVVAPPRHAGAAVVVKPDYGAPGPDWKWSFHGRYGWGWRHHRHGWHRGWR